MSRQAVVKAYIGEADSVELDLQPYIMSFHFEESMEADNTFDMTLRETYDYEILGHASFRPGKKILFQFGLSGGAFSEVFIMYITKIVPSFSQVVRLKVSGNCKTIVLKKSRSNAVYNNMTASDIAKKIAKKYNLDYEIFPTDRLHHSVVQANRSDVQLLRDLAKQEEGDYIAYITNDTLFFGPRGTAQSSVLQFDIGSDNIIDFSPDWNEQSLKGAAAGAAGVGVEKSTKEVFEELIGNVTGDETSLGDNSLNMYIMDGVSKVVDITTPSVQNVDSKGNVTPAAGAASKNTVKTTLDKNKKLNVGATVSASTAKEAKGKTKSKKNKDKINVLVAKLIVQGEPTLRADRVITVGGRVPALYSGNWYVVSISHDFGGGPYQNTISLSKNAVNKKDVGEAAAKKNKTVGGNGEKKTVDQYYVLDGDAKRISITTKEIGERTDSKGNIRDDLSYSTK